MVFFREHLESVELVYNQDALFNFLVPKTKLFLSVRGQNLTTLAILSNKSSMASLEAIGRYCPNLVQLWFRCRIFNGNLELLENDWHHQYYKHLQLLYFRVGESNKDNPTLTPVALHYLVRNCGQNLRELTVPTRAAAVTNTEYWINLLQSRSLVALEKLLVLLPGVNDASNRITLNVHFAHFVINFCKCQKSDNLP